MLLKTKQVATILGVHVQTVRRFCRDGVLPSVLINEGGENDSPNGHRYRIPSEKVDAFLQARKEQENVSHTSVIRGTEHPPATLFVLSAESA